MFIHKESNIEINRLDFKPNFNPWQLILYPETWNHSEIYFFVIFHMLIL